MCLSGCCFTNGVNLFRSKVDDLRGTPMSVGTLEEIIDDTHAIVSTSVGSEHYVSILSFVDKDQVININVKFLANRKIFIVTLKVGAWMFGTTES